MPLLTSSGKPRTMASCRQLLLISAHLLQTQAFLLNFPLSLRTPALIFFFPVTTLLQPNGCPLRLLGRWLPTLWALLPPASGSLWAGAENCGAVLPYGGAPFQF